MDIICCKTGGRAPICMMLCAQVLALSLIAGSMRGRMCSRQVDWDVYSVASHRALLLSLVCRHCSSNAGVDLGPTPGVLQLVV